MTTTSAPRPRMQPGGPRPRAAIAAKTLRTDRWWFAPLLTVTLLVIWVAYATVRAFMQKWYFVEAYHYLTPFYSPCWSVGCDPEAALFGWRFLPDWKIIPYAAITLPTTAQRLTRRTNVAGNEPVTSPDQRKPVNPRKSRIGA